MYVEERSEHPEPPNSARHADGTMTLTPRENEIVAAVVDGRTNRQIADQLGITEQTVKNHLTSVFGKVGVGSRLQLALAILRRTKGVKS